MSTFQKVQFLKKSTFIVVWVSYLGRSGPDTPKLSATFHYAIQFIVLKIQIYLKSKNCHFIEFPLPNLFFDFLFYEGSDHAELFHRSNHPIRSGPIYILLPSLRVNRPQFWSSSHRQCCSTSCEIQWHQSFEFQSTLPHFVIDLIVYLQ